MNMNRFGNALSLILSLHTHKHSCPEYIHLFDLAFHHIWTDSITPLPPPLPPLVSGGLSCFPLIINPFNFPCCNRRPSCPLSLPNFPLCSPRFPIDGLCLAVSKANTRNQCFTLPTMSASKVITSAPPFLFVFCLSISHSSSSLRLIHSYLHAFVHTSTHRCTLQLITLSNVVFSEFPTLGDRQQDQL